jgi:hypothetical protein
LFAPTPLGTPLCPHDRVAFRFTPSTSGWIQVLSRGGSETGWHLVYPDPQKPWEPPAFGPGAPVRLPAVEGWGFSPDPVGPDWFLIAVSPTPFSAEQAALSGRLLGREEPARGVPPAMTGGGLRGSEIFLLRDLGVAESAHVVGGGERWIALELTRALAGACPAE